MKTDNPKKYSIQLRFDNGIARLSIEKEIRNPSISPENSHTHKYGKLE